jgi:hypothetical protein
MKQLRLRSNVFSLLALVAAAPGSAFEVDPSGPTSCDEVRLIVSRHFDRDCDWSVEADVQRVGSAIDVGLLLIESFVCSDEPVELFLDISLGRLEAGEYRVSVSWSDLDRLPETGLVAVRKEDCTLAAAAFLRGDADSSASLEITDALAILGFLFLGADEPGCVEAADADGSGVVNIADAVYVLSYLFLGGFRPVDPFERCDRPPQGVRIGCKTPQCIIEEPPDDPTGVWMALGDGCRQCSPCNAPSLDEVVAKLEAGGFVVLASATSGMAVCLACDICPSGRVFLVRVPSDQVEALTAQGWFRWEDEVPMLERGE